MDIDRYIQEIESIATQVANNYESDEIRTPIEPYHLDENMLNSMLQMTDVKRQIITENEKKQTNMIRCRAIDSLDVDLVIKILLTSIYIEIWEKCMKLDSFNQWKDIGKITLYSGIMIFFNMCGKIMS